MQQISSVQVEDWFRDLCRGRLLRFVDQGQQCMLHGLFAAALLCDEAARAELFDLGGLASAW